MTDIKEIRESIEQQWRRRVTTQCLRGKRHLEEQAAFFSGAIAALIATGTPSEQAMLPIWVVSCLSGRPICEDVWKDDPPSLQEDDEDDEDEDEGDE